MNMTALPEAALARELGMCLVSVALVTDRDAGVDDGSGQSVTEAEVFAFFAANIERLRGLLGDIIRRLPSDGNPPCGCSADAPPTRPAPAS